MEKLIEMHQENLIECDNPQCDFKIPNPTGDPNEDISEYLNKACPLCGENLLTEKDYKQSLNMMRAINWLNKWFSWTTLFMRNRTRKKSTMKVHEGIKINDLD